MSGTDTVMVDVQGGNSLMYLPLDKLGNKSRAANKLVNSYQSESRVTESYNPTNTPRPSSRGRMPRGR